jgi:hypothetical protein
MAAVSMGYVASGRHGGDPNATPVVAEAQASAAPISALPATAAASAVPKAAMVPQAGASASQSARIETIDVPSQRVPNQLAASAPAGNDPFATLSHQSPGLASSGAAPATVASSAARSARAVPAAAKASARHGSHSQTPKPRAAHAVARKRDDPDVDLLAALMAHVAAPASGPQKPANQTTLRRDKGLAPGELSIADLVRRCERMQGNEALECRRRICDGYWGKAQACPAPRGTANGEPRAR